MRTADVERVEASTGLDLTSEDGVERPEPGKAPVAFRIWRQGRNDTDRGPVLLTPEALEQVLSAQESRGNLYSIDYDHQSLAEGAPPAARVAAGWHRLEARDGELWAVDVVWAPLARTELEQRPPGFRYFSPAYDVDKKSRVLTRYLNMAVTNNPATWHVTALAAATGDTPMDDEKKDPPASGGIDMSAIVAALHKLATEGQDEEQKAKARAALSALMPQENKGQEAAEGEEEPPPSSRDLGKPQAASKKATAPAPAAAASQAAPPELASAVSAALAPVLSQIEAVKASLAARERAEKDAAAEKESQERAELAGRKGLARELASIIKDRRTPLDVARTLAGVRTVGAERAAITTETVLATRGGAPGERGVMSDPETKAAIDAAMGLQVVKPRVRLEGNKQVFPVMTPEQVREAYPREARSAGKDG